jgi:hypothetical protein
MNDVSEPCVVDSHAPFLAWVTVKGFLHLICTSASSYVARVYLEEQSFELIFVMLVNFCVGDY